jgi:predicted dehydrogenase
VVGLGHLGRHHARNYADMPGLRLSALCDTRAAARLDLGAELEEVPFFTELQDLMEVCDLVSVVTPTHTHLEVAGACVRRGLDVLVEKPIASTMEEGRALVALAEESGCLLQIGHIEEFNPVVEACRDLVQRPRYIEAHRMSSFSGRSLDIDVICDLMIHDLDLVLQWIASDVAAIHAVGVPVLSPEIDMASARVEFVDGTVANLTASRVSSRPQRRMRLFTADRYLRLDFSDRTVECLERTLSADGSANIVARPVEVKAHDPLRCEVESFVECVRTREAPRVGGVRALRALDLALAIRAQSEERARRWEAVKPRGPTG